MIAKLGKRFISFLLVLLMLVSMFPMQTFASEAGTTTTTTTSQENDVDQEPSADSSSAAGENSTAADKSASPEVTSTTKAEAEKDVSSMTTAVQKVQDAVDAFNTAYFDGKGDLSYDEIAEIVLEIEDEDYFNAIMEDYEDIVALAEKLSESEINTLKNIETVANYGGVIDALMNPMEIASKSGTFSAANGDVSIAWEDDNENGSATESSGTFTFKALAKKNFFYSSNGSNTITITNNSVSKATISFDYKLSVAAESFTINGISYGTAANTSGSYTTAILENGASIKVYIECSNTSSATTLALSNFVCTPVTTATATVTYDSSAGVVKNGSTTVASGTATTVNIENGLTAVANSGATFLGWVDSSTHKVLSTDANYAITDVNVTVQAAFAASSNAWFGVGAMENDKFKTGVLSLTSNMYYTVSPVYLFNDLNTAATFAESSSYKGVVLMNTATIAAGDYTIPSGVTLLIPFDDANTLYTTAAGLTDLITNSGGNKQTVYTTPTKYRTLTMASGANITVNGAMSLSTKVTSAAGGTLYGASPSGACSFVNMSSNSKITVNSGGSLYAYGYIYGSGSVVANSGANIYELFQICDFRGGNASTNMKDEVFALSQYYVQNIEVPLTLYAGATEYAYNSIMMSNTQFNQTVAFLSTSSDSFFSFKDGYFIKKYDGTTDRLVVDAYNCNLQINPITMEVGTTSIKSDSFVLPINGNITINVHSGSNVTVNKQNVALLPGVIINVDKNATCTIGSDVNMYVYDVDNWGGYCGSGNYRMIAVPYAASRTCTRTVSEDAKIVVNGTLDASAGYIYTTAGNAKVCSDGVINAAGGTVELGKHGTDTVTYQASQTSTEIESVEIPINPVVLLNGDGSYTETAGDTDDTNTYRYHRNGTNGKWIKCSGVNYVGSITTEATCTEKGVKTWTCSGCSDSYTEEIAALGHNEITYSAVAATCTEAGYNEYKYCSRCNTETVPKVEIPATGHKKGEGTPNPDATCTTAGKMDYYCSACKEKVDEWTVTIPAKGHTEVKLKAVAATCTKTGLTEGKKCSVCNEILLAQQTTQKTDHAYAKTGYLNDKEPNCENGATEIWICSGCGDKNYKSVDKLGHDYVGAITPATCEEQGYTTHTCSRCGDTYKDTYTDATKHNYTEVKTTAGATCTDAAYTVYKCKNLGCKSENKVSSGEALGHKEGAGTVTAPADCTTAGVMTYYCTRENNGVVCGAYIREEVISATGHSWGEGEDGEGWTTTKAATCTENGEKTRTCSECKTEETQTIVATGHGYTTVVTAPTCVAEGYTTYTCSICGKVETKDKTPATGKHTEVIDAAVVPTCTETGLTDGKHCSVCGTVLTAQTVISAKGHTEVIDAAVAPTCTETGLTDGKHCSACNEVIVAQQTVDALGHTEVIDEAQAATCTESGLTDGKHCSVCNEVIVEQQTVEAKGHAEVIDEAQAATCTESGLTDGKHCSVCNEVLVAQRTVKALGHNYNDVVTAPTCTEKGYTTHTCSVCGYNYVDTYVDANGHSYGDWYNTTDPTCTADGEKRRDCKNCDHYETAKVNSPGHDYDTKTQSEVTQEPNCTNEGTRVYYCTRCYDEKNNIKVEISSEKIDALGHEGEDRAQQDATCKEIGYTAGVWCTRCKTWVSGRDVIPKSTVHTWNDGIITIEPTCINAGVKTFTCTVCGETKTEEVSANGHDWNAGEVTIEPTCTNAGVKTFTCTVCSDGTKTEPIAKLGHDWQKVDAKAATCEDFGWNDYQKCSRCDEKQGYNEISAKGHSEAIDAAKAATCTETGLTEGKHCSVCNKVLVAQQAVGALGHEKEDYAQQDATCKEVGYTAGVWCSRCETWVSGHEKIAKLTEHTWNDGEITTQPECEEKGERTYTCTVCGATKKESVSATGHTEAIDAAVEPTCTETGLTEGKHCSVCDKVIVKQETVAATGHSWDAGEVTTEPTCTTDGVKTYNCTRCTATNTETILKYHDTDEYWIVSGGTDATCIASGTYAGKYCPKCNAIEGGGTIPALGHDWDDGNQTVDPTCYSKGTMLYTCLRCTETKTEDIDTIDHIWNKAGKVTKIATCTEQGEMTYSCSDKNCSATKTEYTEIDSTNHNYVDTVVESTCEKTGYTEHKCSRCGYYYTTDPQPLAEHTWGAWRGTNATCTADGYKIRWCSVCNNYEEVSADKTGHTEKTVEGYAATCEASGLTDGVICSVCGTTLTEQTAIPATGHAYDKTESVAAGCETKGYNRYVCKNNSDHTCTDWYDALGHDYSGNGTKEYPATCTDDAYTVYTCQREGCTEEPYTVTDEGSALGHTWGEWDVTTPATCETAGEKKRTCTKCSSGIETGTIDPLGHDTDKTEATPIVTKEATCTKEGIKTYYCHKCYDANSENNYVVATETISKVSHNYNTVKTDPTCTEQGYTTYTCKNCTYSYKSDYVKEAGHAWNDGEVTAQPTCLAAGEKTFTCTVCGDTKTEQVDKLEHKYTTVVKDPTCTERGYTTYTCQNGCNDTYNDNYVDATGHNHTSKVTTEPTCTEKGVRTYTCSSCGDTYTEDIKANGHDYNETVTDPTCTERGYTTYQCKNCDYNYTGAYVSANGHDYEEDVTDPTCTDGGYTTYQCKNCDYNYTGKEVAAKGHTWDGGVETEAASCSKVGTMTYTCTVCGDTKTEDIEKLPHDYATVTIDPTCTEQGYTTYTCMDCNYSYDGDYVNANGHSPVANVIASTCTEGGKTVYTCKNCDNYYSEDNLKDPLGHDLQTVEAKAAACEAIGWGEYQKCSRCDYTEGYSEIEATGHNEVTDEAVEPTCTETGLTEGSHCSECGKVFTEQEEVAATGHTEVTDEAKAPTCTKTGLTEGSHCSACNEVIVEQQTVKANGHTRVTDAFVAPTCTETGLTAGAHCSVCNTVLTAQTVISAKGHTEVTDDAKAPNCTETGLTEGKHCSVCNEVIVAQQTVDALGHTEVIDAAVAPTCTATGKTEGKHCSVCNEVIVEQQTVEAKGHAEVIDEAQAATCTESGLTVGKHCSVCEKVLVRQTVVVATGHTEVIDAAQAATCTATGLTEGKHCSVCNEVLVEQTVIEKLAHTSVFDNAVEATCTEDGMTEGKHCSVCGEIIVAQTVIDALGHDEITHEAQKATYNSVGWDAYVTCTRCDYTTYNELPMLEAPEIDDYDTFVYYLEKLEQLAYEYSLKVPGTDPLMLVIKYIRTGVDRYNSGSWGIMAGYEDAGFAQYVIDAENAANAAAADESEMTCITSLKNINNFYLPNGDYVDFGHMFGTMDISYTNNSSVNHADVAGWAGDLVDLMSVSDRHGVTGTVEEMVEDISENYLGVNYDESDTFGSTDLYGDFDGFYLMKELNAEEYDTGRLTELVKAYFTESLTNKDRAAYFLENRLDGVSLRSDVRTKVYTEFLSNNVVSTLEGTREFESDSAAIEKLREACCYSFADYLCRLAGDYVEKLDNPYFSVFSSETTTLAPGITQTIKHATSADSKQMVYYVATADLTRSDVDVYANYGYNDASEWQMVRVIDQAQAAQDKHSDPDSEYYIENYNVVAAINADGFNMSTGEPSGLLVMEGVEYHAVNSSGFFAILKDGTAMVGSTADYATYKNQLQEAVGGFGTTLIKNGEICITASSNYYTDRASRTAVGITATGKVVFMVLDGRQEPVSCGGSMLEIAQIMFEAGCVDAINLDGGGSTTYVSKAEGSDELAVTSRPSDGTSRSVSTSLMMVSTAPSSTAFDHAILTADSYYLTVGATVGFTAAGVSATGNAVDIPEGAYWAVSNESYGTISEDGILTGKALGDFSVYLMLDGEIVGEREVHVVVPTSIYFTKTDINAVYGEVVTLPVKALYANKTVAITSDDVVFTLSNETAGTIDGLTFVGEESSGIKIVNVTAALAGDATATATLTISLYAQGEASFDFNQATSGDRMLAWMRIVSNSTTSDNSTYVVEDLNEDMVTSYIFAMDMTQIPIPEELESLTYMLPGSDLEDASAWNFLLQLAERVSALTEVKAEFEFDPEFEVDYSDLTIVTDYFELTNIDFDEENNKLILTLNWIKQSEPIDAETANPYCIVSGISLTPKDDAAWDSRNRLTPVNSGSISYDIYLRANALYTFCQKEENQQTFGLLPFVNPDNENEKGGHFSDTYKEFEDIYTLVNELKNGWYAEEGGFAYYVEGAKLTGVKQVDGLYYDFGENGINLGKTPYTGVFYNDELKAYSGAKIGELVTGWVMFNDSWYYFKGDGSAASGNYKVSGVTFSFEETGRLTSGVFVQIDKGIRYYYGPGCYANEFATIDGYEYYFDNDGCYLTGYQIIRGSWTNPAQVYLFADDGKMIEKLSSTGFLTFDGNLHYLIDGIAQYGLFYIDGDYYYFNSNLVACTGSRYIVQTNDLFPEGTYEFGDDYKMLHGFVTKEDGTYYYVNGQKNYAGLICIDGDYYYVNGSYKRIENTTYYVTKTNGIVEAGYYKFDENGKMIIPTYVEPVVKNGIYNEDGTLYYYVDNVKTYAGLIKIDDDYYYANGKGIIVTGRYYVTKNNGIMESDYYEFDENGKMIVKADEEYDVTATIVAGASKLYEPWGLRYFATFTGEDISKIANRGIVILKEDYYTDGMTVEQFCASQNAHVFTSANNDLGFEAATTKYTNGRYYATLTEGIYSYDISAYYYVAPYAVMENGEIIYGTIKKNSMENILNTNLGLDSISAEEKAICTCILNLKESVAEHYAAEGVPGAAIDMDVPRGDDQTAAAVVKTKDETGVTANVVAGASRLIEPWGLRYFATYSANDSSIVITERGMVILCENSYDSSYANNQDAMRLNPDAYVFTDTDGTLVYDEANDRYYGTVVEGISSKDIADVYYVVPYVVLSDGSYVYGEGDAYTYGTVKENSMLNIMNINLTLDTVPETEKAVCRDIIALYEAVKAYYEAQQ